MTADLWPTPAPEDGDGSEYGESVVNDGTPGAVGSAETLRRLYRRGSVTRRGRALLGQIKAVTVHEDSMVASLMPTPLRKATLRLVGVGAPWPVIASPNYSSRKGGKIRLLIFHTAEGALTRAALGAFFGRSSSRVSSHAGIDDLGITRYVPCEYSAWTAANANPYAVQAELCAFTAWNAAEWGRHTGMLENAARWLAAEAKEHGIPLVRLTPAQTRTGSGVCVHHDITIGWRVGSHVDCGTSFPIDAVIARARQINSGTDDFLEELLMADVYNPYANGGKGGNEPAAQALGFMEQRIREGLLADVKAQLPALVAAAVKTALADAFAQVPVKSADELLARKLPTPTYRDGKVVTEDTRVAEILPRGGEASIVRHLDGQSS